MRRPEGDDWRQLVEGIHEYTAEAIAQTIDHADQAIVIANARAEDVGEHAMRTLSGIEKWIERFADREALVALLDDAQARIERVHAVQIAAHEATVAQARSIRCAEHLREQMGPRIPAWAPAEIGRAVAGLATSQLKRTPARGWVDTWLAAKRHSFLVLAGAPGLGKSIASAMFVGRFRGAYVRAFDLGAHFRANYGSPNEKFGELIAERALVIDDVAARASGRDNANEIDGVNEALDVRIGTREGRRLLTIITTNLKRAELEAYLGERAADRLAENAHFADVVGASMRRSHA